MRIIGIVHCLLGYILPMTGFRRVYSLHAYSGGTVPDFHRIHYLPSVLNRSWRHLNVCYSVYENTVYKIIKYKYFLSSRIYPV